MKTSIRFRLSAVICAAILLIVAFSFLPLPVQADKAEDAAKGTKGAKELTEAAEKATKEADKAQKDAAEAEKKAGVEKTQADKDADAAAKEADEAAKAADEAQDKAQKEQQEADDAANDAKNAGGRDEELNKEAEKQKKEADDAKAEADRAEKEAADKEKAADDADKKADDADKKIENRDVKKKKKAARDARKKARAARRAAAKKVREAKQLLHERKKREGKNPTEGTKELEELLEELRKRLYPQQGSDQPPKQGTVIPLSAGQTTQTRTANGLHIVNFDTLHGRVIVHLPDDMRAGDTISGTVIAEPKGQTKEERERNLVELKGLAFEIKDFSFGVENPTTIGSATGRAGRIPVAAAQPFTFRVPQITVSSGSSPGLGITLSNATGSFTVSSSSAVPVNPSVNTAQPSGQPPPNDFQLPAIGQQGRPLEIFGPFDGNLSNTTLRFGPAGSTVQDFEKNTENVSGGFGLIRPLAESPNKIVFDSPTNLTGPAEILLKEGGVATKGTYRSVGVRLSAPKTNLLRGERTTVTVEVSGLEGIQKDVPLQLDTRGVVQMDGGNFQNLTIHPTDIQLGGRYTTTRAITGQQAGAFTVTATVVVRPFDVCLRDDSAPIIVFLWNSFTGDYIFTNSGSAGQQRSPDGTVQPGGAGQPKPTDVVTPTPPIGLNLTGTGRPAMKGCIITLSHNAPDRRVFARLDVCTNTGSAEVQTNSPKTDSNITDSNTANNVCPSSR